jgi:RHS repeat-associated protein
VSNQTGVQGVFSSSGALQELALYSLYGIQTIMSGTRVTPFGYQGSYTDSTGLIYLINRYYDPTTDQFLSIDPDAAQTGQPYAYTGDDPLNSTDPLGLLTAAQQLVNADAELVVRQIAALKDPTAANLAAVNALAERAATAAKAASSFSVPLGTAVLSTGAAIVTFTASATVSGSSPVPVTNKVNVDSGGTASLTVGSTPISISAGGTGAFYVTSSIPSLTVSKSVNVNGDKVTTSISASVKSAPTEWGLLPGTITGFATAFASVTIKILTMPVEACVENAVDCEAGATLALTG